MKKIMFLSWALVVLLACRVYGQQVNGAHPEVDIGTGVSLSTSGYGNPVFLSSGTTGGAANAIRVIGGGGVSLKNMSGGGMGVVSAMYGGYIDLGNGTTIVTQSSNSPSEIVGATGILSEGSTGTINSTVIAANVTITASGDKPYGVYAFTNGIIQLSGLSTININSNALNPNAGWGIVANGSSAITAENIKITADGINGILADEIDGVSAWSNSNVNVSGSSNLTINALHSYGVRAEDSGLVALNTLDEKVTGTVSAYGIYAASGGAVTVSGVSGTSNITVSANNAYGISLNDNSAMVNINNVNMTVSGVSSVAALEFSGDSTTAATVNVTNSSLKSGGDGILASNSIANISFANSSLQNTVNVFNISNSTVNFTGNNMTLNGSASADASSTLNVTLQNSLWNLSGASNISVLTLDNSRVNVGANASVKNVIFGSGGQVYYVDGTAGNRSATFTQATGLTPGIIGMQFNTPSLYDKLVLGAGSSGSYKVDLIDINTSVKNPKYFQVLDMVNTSGSPVTLHLFQTTYTLGIYQYDLTELHNGNLFGFEATYVGIDPVAGHEISQSLLGSMAGGSKLIETASNNLMKRLGDLRLSKDAGSPLDSLWVRGYGKQYKLKGDMDGNVYGMEAGYDKALDEDYKYHLGIMGGYGQESTNFTALSNGTLTGPSAGIYGTWLADNGIYLDVTGRYFWLSYENNINPVTTTPFKIDEDATGYEFSFELGKRFMMDQDSSDKWYIEPRAQYNYSKTGGYTAEKNGIEMRADDYVSSLAELGVNIGLQIPGFADKNTYEPYFRVAAKYEFDGKANAGIDDVSYSRDYGGARLEGALGFDAQIGAKLAIYAEVSYENGSSFEGFGENLGIRFAFGEPRDKNTSISKKEALAAMLEADQEKQKQLADELARREAEEKAREEREARQAAINTGSDEVLEKEKAAAEERRLKPVLKSFNLGMANFAVGKSELTPKAQADIKKMAEDIKNLAYKQITIEGHTDNTGSDQLNKSLSNARAKSVFLEFVKNGVPEDKMTYIGFASRMPIADNKTAGGRAKNRRVEIFVE